MSGQLKLGLGGHQEGRQKTLLSCILSFDGISHKGRPVQDYEDEPRLCLFGLALTFHPLDFICQYSASGPWRTPLLQSEMGDCCMYHNVHLWTTTPLEGQFPRTNRKGAVEESLLWLDFQSLPKALMSIAHVYFHFIMSLEWGGNAHLGKPVMGGLWLDHFRRWWWCVDRSYNQPPPAHLGHFPSGIKPPGRTNPPRLSSNLLATGFQTFAREKSILTALCSGSCH